MKIFIKNHYALVLCYLCIGVLFGLLNYNIPLSGDDYSFSMKYGEKTTLDSVISDSFSQSFQTAVNAYNTWSGRFVPHFLASFFLGWIGVEWFNLFNTVIFLGIIFLINKITFRIDKGFVSKTIIVTFFLWLLLPVTMQTTLLKVGSIAYMIPGFFLLLFVYLFQFKKNLKITIISVVVLFLISVFCSFQNEAASIPTSGALFFYLIIKRKSITKTQILLVSGFWVGTILTTFSPGTFVRSGGSSGSVLDFLWTVGRMLISCKASLLLIVLLLFQYMKHKQFNEIRTFINNNILYFLILIITIICLLGLAMINDAVPCRAFFFMELFSIILLTNYIYLNFQKVLNNKYIASVAAVSLFVIFSYQILTNFNYKKIVDRDLKVMNSNLDTIVPCDFLPLDRSASISRYLGKTYDIIPLPTYLFNNIYIIDNYCITENEIPCVNNWYNYNNYYIHKISETGIVNVTTDTKIKFKKILTIPFINFTITDRWYKRQGVIIINKEGNKYLISQINTKKPFTKIVDIKLD